MITTPNENVTPRQQPDPDAEAASHQATRPAADAERWVRDHGDVLWRFCLARTRSRDAAEEVMQETLLAALERSDTFAGLSTEQTWLLSIASHKCADHFRRLNRSRQRSAESDHAHNDGTEAAKAGPPIFRPDGCWVRAPEPWHTPVDREELSLQILALRRCLDQLPPNLGEAVWLRDLMGLPGPQICEATGLTPTNLWTRLHRARAALRQCIEAAVGSGAAAQGSNPESKP